MSRYDPSAAGCSLGAGGMTDIDPCRCVTELAVCPRCAGRWPGPRWYVPRYQTARWVQNLPVVSPFDTIEWAVFRLMRALYGPSCASWAIRKIAALTVPWRIALPHAIGEIAEHLWPDITDGASEPPCGWCGWDNGANLADTRPPWECPCGDDETLTAAICHRCRSDFTAARPPHFIREWGTGPTRQVHRDCLCDDDLSAPPL